jgi:nitrogen-specific signal transduction histidine kinase
VSSSPIDTVGGKRARVVSIHDITGKIQAEREARRAQRMESVGTLAGGIAHDLNNLLSPIALGIGLLREHIHDKETLESIATMERNAKRAASVVGQLLTFARGSEGARVPLRVQDVIREVAEIVQSTFPKSIHLTVRCAPNLWPALADATQINQVLLNLCLNARDALSEGGQIEVVATNAEIDEHFSRMHRDLQPGRFVLLEVIDNGCGIEPEIIDRIFEPFFTTKTVHQGSGLGLSNVLGIIRGHAGWVGVASKPGKGSSFKVYLPVAPGEELTASPECPTFPRGRGELILLVDDELAILEITAKALRAFGYKVLIAEDGARAVGLFAMHHQEVRLVLTDMMMPGMDGAALIATLLRMSPSLRIIASSGHNAADNAQSALEAGAASFLPKPYSAESMLRAIADLVGQAA